MDQRHRTAKPGQIERCVTVIHHEGQIAGAPHPHPVRQRCRHQPGVAAGLREDLREQGVVRPAAKIVQRAAPDQGRPAILR